MSRPPGGEASSGDGAAARQRGGAAAVCGPAAALAIGLLVAAGCRERQLDERGEPIGGKALRGSDDSHASTAAPPAAPRIMYPGGPGSFADLVSNARHGVVAIKAGAPVKSGPAAMFPGAPEATADVALGTGFLIEAHGVFVLTNDHIAAAANELHVVLPDRRDAVAKLVGRDPRLDIALLSVDAPGLSPLTLGSSDDLQVGEWLVVLGDPFGDEVTASVGVVSATARGAAGSLAAGRPGTPGGTSLRTFLQTDARIHRGNSGGPVLDTAGQVVGVALATGDRPGELSFAIPINRVKEVLAPLREHGQVTRSWLGVLVQPVTAELAQTAGLPRRSGALVTEVKAASPAARAGLRVGDILIKWADREVDPVALPAIVAQAPNGAQVTVVVWRNRAELQVPIVLEKMPE